MKVIEARESPNRAVTLAVFELHNVLVTNQFKANYRWNHFGEFRFLIPTKQIILHICVMSLSVCGKVITEYIYGPTCSFYVY